MCGRAGGGTWKDKEAWQVRKEEERRSNLWIYKLVPGLHHQAGRAMADAANAQLTPATEAEAEQRRGAAGGVNDDDDALFLFLRMNDRRKGEKGRPSRRWNAPATESGSN